MLCSLSLLLLGQQCSLQCHFQPNKALDRINEITKGLGATESDIYLDLPEIAENGNRVKLVLKWIAL